jgi:hypothetical protein
LRGQRAKGMKFRQGYMIKSGQTSQGTHCVLSLSC